MDDEGSLGRYFKILEAPRKMEDDE